MTFKNRKTEATETAQFKELKLFIETDKKKFAGQPLLVREKEFQLLYLLTLITGFLAQEQPSTLSSAK